MRLAIFLAITLLAASQVSADRRHEFFVSPKGSDKNPGTKAKPFATVKKAWDAVQSLKKTRKEASIHLREGVYTFTDTLTLTSEDAGIPVVFQAHAKESVCFTGGREIAGFRPVTDPEVLAKLDETARGKVLQCDLKEQGITDFGQITARGFGRPVKPAALELFFNDQPMTLARWPNNDWAIVDSAPDGPNGGKFCYEGDRPKRWKDAEDIWLHGYWTWAWADSYENIKAIDLEKREIETVPPHGVYGYAKGKRYYAFNILEELDSPGEWYVDRKTGMLYFWPPEPIEKGKCQVSILEKPMVSIKGCSNVTFAGITFEACRGSAVEIGGGAHNLIKDCTFRNIGNIAVWVGGEIPDISGKLYADTTFKGEAGRENGVSDCTIYNTGDGGLVIGGGDRLSLTPAGNYADNNHIYNFSRWSRTYRPAVMLYGVGNRVAHNHIHHGPHTAVLIPAGNDNIIEYNDIHHVCMETGDAGAFYIGRDFSMRGNVVRYNFFHDLGGYQDKFSAHNFSDTMAVYLDDWASGTLVFGNIFHKANRAVLVGGGRDNTIENNIFIDCSPAVHVDARGLGWAKNYFDGSYNILFERLKAVKHDQPPYSVRYRGLKYILDDEPAVPKGNKIVRNICVGGKWLDLHHERTKDTTRVDDNFTEGDPGFVATEKGDFRLKEDSPVWKIGFTKIPVEGIGRVGK